MWVDVNAACGQCHGGGSNKASTTLTVANSTDATLGKTLTVNNANGIPGNSVTGKRSQYIVEERRFDRSPVSEQVEKDAT